MYYYIYILTNKAHTVFYTGQTNDLKRRTYEHRNELVPGFTKKYKTKKLIYYEVAESRYAALTREEQIKDYRREKKKALINSMNRGWKDLYYYI